MSHLFFGQELEGVATFWRIHRRDGVTHGFTAHDRDLWFDGILHRAAPGMLPSAIRRNASLQPDSVEVEGALTHDALSEFDLEAGRFDSARIAVGAVDWETLASEVLYRGTVGSIRQEDGQFQAELHSAKAALTLDPIPRTSPTCRAQFCGPGCSLSTAGYTHEGKVTAIDLETNLVGFSVPASLANFLDGSLRWIDGPQAGLAMEVISVGPAGLLLDIAIHPALEIGMRALLREGCDHTLQTCSSRFGNAINFQGEPFLPGNDILARYPTSYS